MHCCHIRQFFEFKFGHNDRGFGAVAKVVFKVKSSVDLARQRIRIKSSRAEKAKNRKNGELVEKGIQNWRGVLAALRLLNRIPGVASASVELFTRDVWYYLTKLGTRSAVDEIVTASVPQDEPCVIVGHSLGSVVAYNILMNMDKRAHVQRFITLGSPLGIEAIYNRLPSDAPPRKAPSGVSEWFNARDSRDVVSLFDIPGDRFRGAPVVQNYSEVRNESENRHGIDEYLRDA